MAVAVPRARLASLAAVMAAVAEVAAVATVAVAVPAVVAAAMAVAESSVRSGNNFRDDPTPTNRDRLVF